MKTSLSKEMIVVVHFRDFDLALLSDIVLYVGEYVEVEA